MAQSTSGLVSNAIDSEQMVILAQPSASTDTPAEFFTKLENTVVCSLVADLPATVVLASSGSSNATIKAISDNFAINEISKADRGLFSLETTDDVSEISFALLSQYDSSIQITLDSSTYDIGTSSTPATKSVSIDSASSIYDSNAQFSYSYNSDAIKSTVLSGGSALPINLDGDFSTDPLLTGVGPWTALFDSDNTNVNYNKAINSEYNNPNYERPMTVEEHDTFNSANALGMDLLASDKIQHYYTLDADGKPIQNDIPVTGASSTSGDMSVSYRLFDNGVSAVKSADFVSIDQSDLGSYRVQQFPDVPLITITEDEVDNSTTSQEDISKFPMFNANANQTLPTNTKSMTQFRSMFGTSEVILPEYKYTVTVTEDPNSGYSLDQTTLVETDDVELPIFSLDNSSLKDNQVYMKNYVNGSHTLSFADATLEIQPVSTASATNVSDVFSLDTQREYIKQSDYSDGQIKINTRTPDERDVYVNGDLAVDPRVYYNTEGSTLSRVGISSDLKTNRYAAFLDQLVIQKSATIDGSFMKHNDVALDLYKNGIINSNFNTSDFEFTATNKSSVPAEVIRITPSKQLSSVNGFCKTDLTAINGIYSYATVSNLSTTLIGSTNVFDKLQMLFNLKKLTGSKIKTSATTAGWALTTSGGNDNLVSSSASAFASDSTNFPSLELTKSLISDSIPGIGFKISVLTEVSGNATNVDQLKDKVKIEYWSTNSVNDKTELIIPQELLIKTSATTPIVTVGSAIPILASDLSGKLSGKQIDVCPVTSVKQYKLKFDLPLRGFNTLDMTTPTITVTTVYHIIKDRPTNEQLPSSFHQYVKNGFYKNITESFANVTSVSGTFDKNDLCDMLMKVVSKDTDAGEVPTISDRVLTDTVSVSMYYGIDVKTNLTIVNQEGTPSIDGDVTIRCECDYSNQSNNEGVVTLNDNNGYLLQLTNIYNTNFSCDYWSATLNNITADTSIGCVTNTTDYSDKRLTVQNAYSSISTWNTTGSYTVVVSYADNEATTILSIQDISNVELYQIKTKNFTYLNTLAFISNVDKDIHRVDSWIGQSPDGNTFVEKFIQADYTNSVFEIHTGVYLEVLSTSPFYQLVNNGKYYKFSLKQDLMGVNLIGNVSNVDMFNIGYNGTIPNHVVTNNYLSFQYDDSNSHVSRVLTIERFRGFFGPSPNSTAVVQVYTIKRDTMVATLTVQRSSVDASLPTSITQSWNVYAGDVVSSGTAAHIVDTLSGSVGDIGLKITFYLSMLTASETRSFPVYTKGDVVTFQIVNPNVADGSYRSTPSSTTLKSFVLDTFGGSNYNTTAAPLSINSYRLKINTQNSSNLFDNTTAAWSVELKPRYIKIYQNTNYLGNPVNIDTNDAYQEPDASKWTNVTPDSRDTRSNFFDFIGDGITVNGWTFSRVTALVSIPSVSFYIMAPPYYKLSIIQSVSKSLPCANSTTGLRTIYLPVVDNKVYNPFTATKTYTYSNGTTTATVTNIQDVSNNVTFTNTTTDPVSLSSFTTSSSKYHFVVESAKVLIKLIVGLKSQEITQSIITLFDNMPANRLMYNIQDSSPYFYKVGLVNSSSGITMKLFQPENANTPYPDLTTEQIYSTQRNVDYNSVITIDNFFIYPASSLIEDGPINNTFALDLPTGNGNKVYMYTRETSIASNGDHVVTVYRYAPFSNVNYTNVDGTNLDYNNVDANGAPTLSSVSAQYYTRSKKQFTLPVSEFKTFISSSTTDLKTSFETFVKDYATKNNIVADFNSQVWGPATAFEIPNGTYNSIFFSLVCPSQQARSTIPPKFFSVATDQSPCKAVYVTKPPLLTSFNKFGVPTFSVSGWGTMKSQAVSVKNLIVSPGYNTPVAPDMSNINKNSVIGHKNNSLGLA